MDAAETLAAATQAHATRNAADLQLIELSLRFADLHPDPATIPGHVRLPGGERGWYHGGPGCPGFAEFAAADFGAAIDRSAGSAAVLIGQSLALRHRHPRILAKIRSRHGEPWKARHVAALCVTLSTEAAAIVDRRVAPILDSVTTDQLEMIVKAAIKQADPEGARVEADRKARERGVYAGHTDEHGSTTLHIKAATGAVIRFKATLRQLADALTELGYTQPLQHRMAMAIDIISDPALAHELLALAHHLTQSTPTPTPAATPPPAHPHPTGTRRAGLILTLPRPPRSSTPAPAPGRSIRTTPDAVQPQPAPAAHPQAAPGASRLLPQPRPPAHRHPHLRLHAPHPQLRSTPRRQHNASPRHSRTGRECGRGCERWCWCGWERADGFGRGGRDGSRRCGGCGTAAGIGVAALGRTRSGRGSRPGFAASQRPDVRLLIQPARSRPAGSIRTGWTRYPRHRIGAGGRSGEGCCPAA